jgi:hypothetical protein
MPETFTDEMVLRRLAGCQLSADGKVEERRERLARYVAHTFGDHLEAWEIRTGRPWSEMTAEEAAELIRQHPKMRHNAGVLSRLVKGG